MKKTKMSKKKLG